MAKIRDSNLSYIILLHQCRFQLIPSTVVSLSLNFGTL